MASNMQKQLLSILETNNKSQANFEEYEKIQHKRRRAYLKPIA